MRVDPVSTTRRLELRPLALADVDSLLAIVHQEGVRRYLCDGQRVARSRVVEWVRASQAEFSAGRAGLWGVRPLHDTEQLAGFVGFLAFYEPPVHELMFAVATKYWGRGYAVEASRAAIDWSRNNGGSQRIRASTDEPNAASVRTLKRLGFELSSTSRPEGTKWVQLHFVLED